MADKVIRFTCKCQSFLLAISRSINQSINQSINRSINLRSPPVNVLCRERMTCAVKQTCIQVSRASFPSGHGEITLLGSLRVRSIGKSGFRFSKSKSGFPNRTRNPKTDFTPEKSVLRVDFN